MMMSQDEAEGAEGAEATKDEIFLPRPPPWPFTCTEAGVHIITWPAGAAVDTYRFFSHVDHVLASGSAASAVLRTGRSTLLKARRDCFHAQEAMLRNGELEPVDTQDSACGSLHVTLGGLCPGSRLTYSPGRVAYTDTPDMQALVRAQLLPFGPAAHRTAEYTYTFTFRNCYVRDFFTRVNTLPCVTIHRDAHIFRLCTGPAGEPNCEPFVCGCAENAGSSRAFECTAAVNINTVTITLTTDRPAPVLGDTLARIVAHTLHVPRHSPTTWLQLRRCIPFVYPLGLTRLVHKHRVLTPLPMSRHEPGNDRQLVYPDHGPYQCVFVSTHPDFPYPGLVANTCANAAYFPSLPCAFKTQHRRHAAAAAAAAGPAALLLPLDFSPRLAHLQRHNVAVPLLEALCTAAARPDHEADLRAELGRVGYAELCMQSCYGQPLEDVRRELAAVGGPLRPERHWRALQRLLGVRVVVLDESTRRIVRPRRAGAYFHNAGDTPTPKRPVACVMRVGGSADLYDVIHGLESVDTPAYAHYAPETGAFTDIRPVEVREGRVQRQWVDTLGRTREYAGVSPGGEPFHVRGVVADTLFAPASPWDGGAGDAAWEAVAPEEPTPAMLLNRTDEFLDKFRATREFVGPELACVQVRTDLPPVLDVFDHPQPRYDVPRRPYVLRVPHGPHEPRHMKVRTRLIVIYYLLLRSGMYS